MKKSLICSTILSVLVLFSQGVQADVNSELQNICTIIKADDKGELRSKMRRVSQDYRLKLRDYYSGITCGNKSLIKTAFINDAVETGTLMIKKMPRDALKSKEHAVHLWKNGFYLKEMQIQSLFKS